MKFAVGAEQQCMKGFKAPPAVALFGLSWLLCAGGGFFYVFRHSNAPGVQAHVHAMWPTASSIRSHAEKPMLLVFVHPHCPCSDASVGELERLMPYVKDKFETTVVFFKPKNRGMEWVKGSLWSQVERMRSRIPGVVAFIDEGGVESERFGAKTSGQVMLYSASGPLVFEGGITTGRGHRGDNYGRAAILAYAQTGKATVAKTAVYGCSLRNPERAVAEERQ